MEALDRRALGQEAEEASCRFLQDRGYDVRERNYRCRHGELDLIVEKDGVLCFVEVRMRSTAAWGDPSQTVSFMKQRRVVKTALHYLGRAGLTGKMLRFDVISVVGNRASARVEHIPNAFDAGM